MERMKAGIPQNEFPGPDGNYYGVFVIYFLSQVARHAAGIGKLFEYEVAWPHLRPTGLLLSDEIFWSAAFYRFCMKQSVRYVNAGVGGFGIVRKPESAFDILDRALTPLATSDYGMPEQPETGKRLVQ
jgi:hypothetical protein